MCIYKSYRREGNVGERRGEGKRLAFAREGRREVSPCAR